MFLSLPVLNLLNCVWGVFLDLKTMFYEFESHSTVICSATRFPGTHMLSETCCHPLTPTPDTTGLSARHHIPLMMSWGLRACQTTSVLSSARMTWTQESYRLVLGLHLANLPCYRCSHLVTAYFLAPVRQL